MARCPIWRHRPPPKSVSGPYGANGKLSLLLWAMKRHQGELRMFGGIWKKQTSGEIPKGADQQFKLTPEKLLALSHLHGLGDPSAGAGGGDLLGER